MNVIREREAMRAEISALCKKLVLSQHAVQMCEFEATTRQEEFLHRVLAEEMENRERSRRARLLSRARIPVYKTGGRPLTGGWKVENLILLPLQFYGKFTATSKPPLLHSIQRICTSKPIKPSQTIRYKL